MIMLRGTQLDKMVYQVSATCKERLISEHCAQGMEFDTEPFCNLLKPYSSRMQGMVQADGCYTKYQIQ